jgi:hypothetical protein
MMGVRALPTGVRSGVCRVSAQRIIMMSHLHAGADEAPAHTVWALKHGREQQCVRT